MNGAAKTRVSDWSCPNCGRVFRAHRRHACVRGSPGALLAPYSELAALYPKILAWMRPLGQIPVEATRTQIAFGAPRRFAFLWVPAMALRRGPAELFLSFGLPRRVRSPRVKQAVEVRSGRWMHHVRLASVEDLDDELLGWLREGLDAAERR